MFCRTWWMIPPAVTSTTRPWFAVESFRLPSRRQDAAQRLLRDCVASSRRSWRPSTRAGSRSWEESERAFFPVRSTRTVAAACCMQRPAASRLKCASRFDNPERELRKGWVMNGKVFLVGAGPGDPELLTLKALRVLQSAEAVLHDDLIGSEILALVPKSAEVRNVGKRCGRKAVQQAEINALLVAFASFGLKVVRLKGGDPLIFGRAGEEMGALRKANVDFEIIPGVTSALASAAAARVSLTQRETASAVVFLTSHHANSNQTVEWEAFVRSGATLAIYMPGFSYERTSQQLMSAGMRGETACAIVSRASSSREQIHRTTVKNLPSAPLLPAPTLLLVGDVVGQGDSVRSHGELAMREWQADPSSPLATVLDVFMDNQVFLGD